MKVAAILSVLLISQVQALAGEVVISQKDKKFIKADGRSPAATEPIKVKVGDQIVFKNDEKEITHNVYSLGPTNAFDIQVQEPGKSSTVTFKEKGKTDIECAIHPNMKLTVEVE